MKTAKLGAQFVHITYEVPPEIIQAEKTEIKASGTDKDAWFIGPKKRHFAYPKMSAADLGEAVVLKLLREAKLEAESVDLLLYSCALNDRVKTGIGGQVRANTGLKNARIMQVDTGCTSYLSLLKVADAMLAYGPYKNAVVLTVTDFISRLDHFQQKPKSQVLGDGASATFLKKGESFILSSAEKVKGENFGLMVCEPAKVEGERKSFSENMAGPLEIEFSRRMLRQLREDSINSVVDVVKEAINLASLSEQNIDKFLCHQPNMGLIQSWRQALGFKANQVYDTFEEFGNLFQSSIPVSLAHGLANGNIKRGQTIACGTFSNGADFSCAMVFRI